MQDLKALDTNPQENTGDNIVSLNDVHDMIKTSAPIIQNQNQKSNITRLTSCVGFKDCSNPLNGSQPKSVKTEPPKEPKKEILNQDKKDIKKEVAAKNIKEVKANDFIDKFNRIRLNKIRRLGSNRTKADLRFLDKQDVNVFYAGRPANGRQVLDVREYFKSGKFNNTNIDSNIFRIDGKGPFISDTNKVCDAACKAAKAANNKRRGGYASRVLVRFVRYHLFDDYKMLKL